MKGCYSATTTTKLIVHIRYFAFLSQLQSKVGTLSQLSSVLAKSHRAVKIQTKKAESCAQLHLPVFATKSKFYLAGSEGSENNLTTTKRSFLPVTERHHVVNQWPLIIIKGRLFTQGTRTHIIKEQPISNAQLRKKTVFHNLIKLITGWTPKAACKQRLIFLVFL